MWKAGDPVPAASGTDRIVVERFATIESTSAHARALISTGRMGERPRAFVAAEQSGGIGRFGRHWCSPAGGLWITLAWPVPAADLPAQLDGLGLRIGVACLRVIRTLCAATNTDIRIRLKWPNDVLVRGRKVLGVLTEIAHTPPPAASPWLLIGVGINANFRPEELDEILRPAATTLLQELGHAVSLPELQNHLLSELVGAITTEGLSRGLLNEAVQYLHGLNRDITVSMPDGSRAYGVLKGLNEHGMAVLDVDGRVLVPPMGSIIMADTPSIDMPATNRPSAP